MATTPFTLPSDAVLYNNGLAVFAVFDVGGVKVAYVINWWDGSVTFDQSRVQTVSADTFAAIAAIDAGNAEELRGMTAQYPTYRQFFDAILAQVPDLGQEARNDPGVRAVLATFAGRPDMTMAELSNLLHQTEWYQSRTAGQLEWDSLSEEERRKRSDGMASQMQDAWFQYAGEAVDVTDPRIANYLEDLASGKNSLASWVQSVVKSAATGNPQSPWSQQVADTQLGPGISIENTAQRLRDLAKRWGLDWSMGTIQDWANQIFAKQASEADVLQTMKDQAAILYPWKPPEMETGTAAQPWVDIYSRLMETSADLFTPKVKQALGTQTWQFEQELKKSPDWLKTKNARSEMTGVIAEAGRRLGFV